MQKNFSVVALISFSLWGAAQAAAGASLCTAINANLVANCGFETASLSSWTVSGNVLNPGGNYFGVDAFDANSGNQGAYVSQDFVDGGATPVNLSETLLTNPGTVYSVSFWLEQDTAPTTGYTHVFSATWGGALILKLTPTVAAPGTSGSFTQYSFLETATAASTALTFAFENDDNYWSFDDVSVAAVTSATPETSSILLAGMALGALLLLRRAASSKWFAI